MNIDHLIQQVQEGQDPVYVLQEARPIKLDQKWISDVTIPDSKTILKNPNKWHSRLKKL